MKQNVTVIPAMRNVYLLFTLFCLTAVLSSFVPNMSSLQAENPPYAKILSAPVVVGSNIEVTVTMDPTTIPDCGLFFFNCNTNNAGIENLDVHWEVREVSDCAGCDLGSTIVASGIIDHGFWGTNCTANSTAQGTNCASPGGCDRTFQIDASLLCPGATYEIFTYAFNSDYSKGVADNSSQGPGPWRCCDGDPDLGNLESMEACTLPINGGTGGGWLNPSYPQSYTFVADGEVPVPTLSKTSSIADGGTVICGEDFTTSITITPNSACPPTKVSYTLLLNGDEIGTASSDCVEAAETFDFTATIIGCPYDPNCAAEGNGLVNALCSQFGVNTLRWEARQDCDNALVAFEEITFSLNCPVPDNLSIAADDQFLCPDESGTVSVFNPANVNIPYPNGTYELHYNNANPYINPALNYLGTGQTATLTNDGTYPFNTPIVISGTIWETYSTSAPLGCEVFANTATFVMLTEVEATNNATACDFGQINIGASGGLPAYDSTSAYTFDATSAGAGTNNTGIFTTLEGSADPIPAGTYTITVSDSEGCNTTIDVEVSAPITITQTPSTCEDFNTISLNVAGGQPDHPDFNDLTQYTIFSDIDGFLGNPDANGDFTATDLSVGTHSITLEYEYSDNGIPSGTFCSNTLDIEVYDNFNVVLGGDCELADGVTITAITGGRDPNITTGGGFAGAGYTVFLSTNPAPSATNNVSSNEGTLTGPGTFTGVTEDEYYVVVEDDRGCQFSVQITALNLDDYTLTNATPACANNTITLQSTGGTSNWTYWLYPLGAAFDNGATDLVAPITSTTVSPGVFTGTFSGIFPNQYTVYGQDGNGCVTLSLNVNVVNELGMTEIDGDCDDFNTVTVAATGGYAGANYTPGTDFTYTLKNPTDNSIIATNNTGVFSILISGLYTIEVNDNNPDAPCTESINVEMYNPFEVTFSNDPCVGGNAIEVTNVTGGRDPAITDFAGASYTIVLSTTAGSLTPALDENNAPLSLTTSDPTDDLPFVFDDLVGETSYYIVVTDGTSDNNGACTYSVGPIELSDLLDLQVTPNTCDTFNSVSAEVVGGTSMNDFYIYPQGAALQGAPNPPDVAYNPTAAANGAVDDTNNNPLAITDMASANFVNVPAGAYTLYAIDGEGCQIASEDIEVYEPFDIVFDGDPCTSFNGISISEVSGGRDPAITGFSGAAYTVFLSTNPAPNATNNVTSNEGTLSGAGSFTGVASGSYFVVLEDDRGCQYSESVSTEEAAVMTATTATCSTTSGTAQATIVGEAGSDWTFYLYTLDGAFDADDPENTTNGWTATVAGTDSGSDVLGNFSGIGAGTYMIYALNENGCQPQAPVEVEVYEDFVLDITVEDCGTGEVVVSAVSGGKDPAIFTGASYEIFLSTLPAPNGLLNVFSNELTLAGAGTFTGVPDGTYYVVVEDDNGCQFSVEFTMTELISISQQNNDCTAGEVTVVTNGGTPDWDFYVYTEDGTFDADDPENADNGWVESDLGDGSDEDNLGEFTGLDEGSYIVYALDQNGCQRSIEVNVFDEITVTNITETCDYGSIAVVATGGSSTFFSYSLVNSSFEIVATNSTGVFTELDAGVYSVSITNFDGCLANIAGLVVNTTAIALTEDSNCKDGFTATGGVGSFTYSLFSIPDNDLVAENTTGLFPDVEVDNYTLVVTDENDCTLSQVVNCSADPCDLAATASTECVDIDNFNVVVELTGTSTYTLDDGVNDALTNQTAGTITLGELANGNYSVTITDEGNDCDDIVLTGSEDCFNCELEVTTEANCVDNNGYNLSVTIEGNGSYTVSDDSQTLLTNQAAATVVLDTLITPDTDYIFYVTNTVDATCSDTITVNNPCEVCDLEIEALNTNCSDSENFDASVVISGTSTYTIADGVNDALTGQTAGTIDLGSFPHNVNYTLTVTDENVDDCSLTQTFTQDCFSCNLSVTATESCVDLSTYEVTIVVVGSGTYSITDGVSINLTNQPAGTYVLGPLPSGAYSITVTSDTDSDCSQTVTGDVQCFDCELNGSAVTECVDVNTFEVTVTFEGEGTYTIDNGLNPPLVGQSSGTYTFGDYPNGIYSIEVTSEVDETCTQTFTGSNNCFECGLAISNIVAECVDANSYEVTFDLAGNGTYAIQYNGQTLTGQTAGTFTVGPFAEGAYNILISSEEDLTCVQTLQGENTCFECDLVVSNVGTDCTDNSNFEVSFTIEGSGTFTISDGVNDDFTGQTAGTFTFGPYPEGGYNITITSETDETCTEIIAGTRDCFKCDIAVLQAVPSCIDANTFNILMIFTGEGLYTITNNSNVTLTNQSSGTVVLGPFSNGDYNINIISEEDPTCQESISGSHECFACVLPNFATTNCIDDDTYEVIFTLTGDDSYTIASANEILTNQTAGNVSVGPFPNGNYAITITSETDPTCNQNYLGALDCTPDVICDPSIVAVPECIDEESYNLVLTLGGTGTFTIEYNNTVLTGQTAGEITIGPFDEEAYAVQITNENDPDCQLPIMGSHDCTVETPCDVAVTSTTVCAGNSGYVVEIELTGTGTFTIEDGVNPPLTNQSEGPLMIGPIPNGPYTISIVSEQDNTCSIEINGSDDCTFNCELQVESFVNCIEDSGEFEVVVSIAGNSTYTVSDGINPPLTGVTQGDVVVGPFSGVQGDYEITVSNEANSFCFQTISGTKFCDAPCDLFVTLDEANCGPDGVLDVTITIEGSSTYTINYGFFGQAIFGATAGTYVLQDLFVEFDDFYNIFVQDEADFNCSQSLSGAGVCNADCILSGNVEVECLDDGGFDMIVTFEGEGFFDMFINLGFGTLDTLLFGIEAGTYTFEGLSGDFYNVSINQSEIIFEECYLNFNGNTGCDPITECDLEASIVTNCVDDDNFEITVTIEGSSTYYLQIDGELNVFIEESGLTAGTYTFGPFPDNDGNFFGYSVFIQDEINNIFECFQSTFISRNCDFDCDFTVDYDVICNNDFTFNIEITVEGTSTYDIFGDFNPEPLINVPAGTYVLGPYPEDFFFFFNVNDNQNPQCFQDIFGTADCDFNPECNLNANIGATCVEGEGSYTIEVSLTGSDTYTISNGGEVVLEGVTEGSFTIGPFENGSYSISIVNDGNPLCSQVFTGGFFCEPPPVCDLGVEFETVCNSDNTAYSIQLDITGTSTYQIISNGETVASGFPALPITIEGFSNNDTYDIVIIDENNALCTQQFSGVFACSAVPSCNLGATVEVVCLDDNSGGYNLVIELEGSGTYFIETFIGIPLEGQTAGTITVGPFFDTFYNVLIFKENNDICNLSLFGTTDCQPDFPPCNVTVQLDINCINNQEYEVTMVIDGNSTYDIYEGLYVELPDNELILGDVEPGTVTVGPFDNGVYDLLIVDQNNPTCYVDFIGSRNCNNPNGCNINAGVTTVCNPDSMSFNVIINLEGTSEYEITVFQELGGPIVLNLENQEAGIIEAGPIFGDEYYIFIQDENRPFCTQDFLGIRSCISEEIPPCDLQLGATTECQTDGSGFNVILDLVGTGTYTIEDGFNTTLFDVEAGEVILGPYPNGFFYNIFVQSEDNFTCFGGLNGFADCSDAVICDLTTSAEISCIEGDTYTIDLTIGGTGSFNVNSNLGNLSGVSAGVYTFGPAALNTYNFTVTNAFNAECQQTLSGTENCVDIVLPCDLTLTASTACTDDKNYMISVNVSGSDTYTVYNNGQVVQTGVTAGELQVGPFASGISYNIEVVNDNNEDCKKSASGIRNCAVTTACDLTATVQVNCLDDSRYELVVNFSGNEGDTYTLNDGVNTPITGQTGGEVTLGPIFNGSYSVLISSETDPTCTLTLNGIKDCTEVLPCDIDVTDVAVNCTSANSYTVTFEFEGTGTFTISDNQSTTLTGQSAGSYTLTDFANGDYAITISSETTPNCSLTFNGSRDCTPGGCDLVAIPTTICTINGSYLVEVELTGSSTYTLDDGVNPPLTNQSSGSILMGPLPQGDYSITITDETDATCSVTLTGTKNCPSLLATIGDMVFNDLNKNGLQDDLQKVVGLQGIKVTLVHTSLGEIATDVSDTNGQYEFVDVPAGDYFLAFEIPDGFAASPQDIGLDDTFDSDINVGGTTPIFSIAEGATLSNMDAGMYDEGDCAGFDISVTEICPNGPLSTFYQLVIAIEGGTPPFTIDLGEYYFNNEITPDDFPLLPIGEVPVGNPYSLVITDANGCQFGPFNKVVSCVTVGVELLTFNGEVQKDGNALQWVTASETNNDYFTLLRSTDGIDFEEIAKVDGNGTTSETNVYDFLDRNAPNGRSYYRLDQTDFDGTKTASNVISLVRGEKERSFEIVQVYPIPTRDVLQIQWNSPQSGSVNLQLYDIVGRELIVQSLTAKSGLNDYSVNVSALPTGTYLLVLANGEERKTVKVVKE